MKPINGEEKDVPKSDSFKEIRYILAYNGSEPGQIFDGRTYSGSVRFIVFSILVIYGGWHADAIARWVYLQFGETLITSPGKEAWHQMVALSMGVVGITIGLIDIYKIYSRKPSKNHLAACQSEELSASSQTDTTESTGSSINSAHDESTDRKK